MRRRREKEGRRWRARFARLAVPGAPTCGEVQHATRKDAVSVGREARRSRRRVPLARSRRSRPKLRLLNLELSLSSTTMKGRSSTVL